MWQFSIKHRKTKTKVITLAIGHGQSNDPIKTQSKEIDVAGAKCRKNVCE